MRSSRAICAAFWTAGAWFAIAAHAQQPVLAFDPLGVRREPMPLPVSMRVPVVPGMAPCGFAPPGSALGLEEAVSRALCRHPLTQRSWANAQVQAAKLGEAEAARLPTLSGVLNGSAERAATSSPFASQSQSDYSGPARAAQLAFEWVIFDFGARSAEVAKAREWLVAANQSFNAAVLDVLYTTARDYFAAVTAQAQVEAAHEAESNAQQSARAAHARLKSGIASISDELQARTAHDQALLRTIDAERAWQEALGTLAIDMGLRPDDPVTLADTAELVPRTAQPPDAVKTLIDEALQRHPRLLAARASLDATEASLRSIRAQTLPSIRIEASVSSSSRPIA
ncbi:MAG TPA: TolC family protein, partial [Paraburkholderia sp.]